MKKLTLLMPALCLSALLSTSAFAFTANAPKSTYCPKSTNYNLLLASGWAVLQGGTTVKESILQTSYKKSGRTAICEYRTGLKIEKEVCGSGWNMPETSVHPTAYSNGQIICYDKNFILPASFSDANTLINEVSNRCGKMFKVSYKIDSFFIDENTGKLGVRAACSY